MLFNLPLKASAKLSEERARYNPQKNVIFSTFF